MRTAFRCGTDTPGNATDNFSQRAVSQRVRRMSTAFFRQHLANRSAWQVSVPYQFAVGCSAAAFGVTILIFPYVQFEPRFLFYCAVLASSRLGGTGPGVLATALTGGLILLPGVSGRANAAGLLEGWPAVVAYAVISLFSVAVIAQLRHRAAILCESEQRFRVLFERSPESIFILDPNDPELVLPIIDCNAHACHQHGYERAELIGQPFGLLDRVARSRSLTDVLVQRVRTEGMVKVETPHRTKAGGRFLLEISATFINVGARELMLCMARDISERKMAEDAVRRANEQLEARVGERTGQLEQANRELEAFSYSISHDLRAPVRAIAGFAQILHEDYREQFQGEAARLFQFIQDNARRMDDLINDLLGFSKLNTHELTRSRVAMTGLAQSVIHELNTGPEKSRATFVLAELPESVGDPSLLRQVFANLIANALKFSRHSASPRVEIGFKQQDGRIVYFIRDNGVGFNMNYASKLFQVFQRLHSPDEFEGTGVGLAIVQRILQRHGGNIWAESEPGAGACFHFSLPACEPQTAEEPGRNRLLSASEVATREPMVMSP